MTFVMIMLWSCSHNNDLCNIANIFFWCYSHKMIFAVWRRGRQLSPLNRGREVWGSGSRSHKHPNEIIQNVLIILWEHFEKIVSLWEYSQDVVQLNVISVTCENNATRKRLINQIISTLTVLTLYHILLDYGSVRHDSELGRKGFVGGVLIWEFCFC